MPVTGLRGRQILDGDVLRNDLNITTSGSAVIRRIIAGTNIGLSSTGVDTGTGDVTINATGLLPLSGGTLTGNLGFANGTSPFTGYIQFGDNTGWVFRFMTLVSGTPTARFSFRDDGTLTATGQYITTRANFTGDGLGQIFLNGTNGNRIDWNAQGVAAPSLTTRSVGTKLVLYPAVSASLVDYALGIESDTMWYSVAANGGNFKWYGGTQLNMHLEGSNLKLRGNYWSNGVEVIGSDGTSNYIQTGAILYFNTGVTNLMRLTNTGSLTIGSSASTPSKLFVFNTNDSIPDLQITHQNGLTNFNTSSAIIISNLYNNGSNGHNLYLTSSGALGVGEYNMTKTWDGVLTFGVSPNGTTITRHFYMYSSGQIRFANYTATTSFSGTAVGVLAFDSLGNIITIPTPAGGSGITGSGTTNYVTKFTGGTTIGNSIIFDNGTNVGIGTITPNQKVEVSGDIVRFRLSSTTAPSVYYFDLESRYDASNTINMYGAGGVNFFRWISNTGAISLNPNGNNVGINTTTPDAPLRVAGTFNGTHSIFGQVDGRGLAIQTLLVAGTNDAGSILNARGAGSGTLIIQTDGTERVRVASNGDTGIGTNTITNTANYTTLQVNGVAGGLLRFSYGNTFAGNIYGSSAELGINTPSVFNLYINNSQKFNAIASEVNAYETFYARKLGAQIQLAGGVGTASGLFQAGNNIVFLADWNTGLNGITIDVSNGILRTRGSAAGGAYIQFERSGTTTYGYVGNASGLIGTAGFNANTDLAIRSEGNINFATSSTAIAQLNTNGRLTLRTYTTTTSHTGTIVGFLAFDSSGNIITTAAPSGSSQWTTNGSDIYYNTGNVGIGATTPLARLHFSTASTSVSNYIRFTNPVGSIYAGQVSNLNWYEIGVPSGAVWMQIRNTGQLRLLQYSAFNSFSTADSVGTLQFDANGNIQTGILPIYRVAFVSGAPITLNNVPSAVSFFNGSNSYITKVDMIGMKRARLVGRVTTAATGGTQVRVRYRTIFSTTASDYLQMGASEIQIPISSNGQFESNWINIVAGAQQDVFVALQTIGGDGSTDPVVSQIHLEIEG